jgi:hypothetical protein
MSTTTATLTKQFAKPVVNGLVSAGLMRWSLGDVGFNFGSTRIGVLPFGFGLGAIGSFLTGTVNAWVIPYTIGKDAKTAKWESMVVSVGTSAAYFAIVPKIMNSDVDSEEMTKLALAGAASEVASSYIYDNIVAGKDSLLGLPY